MVRVDEARSSARPCRSTMRVPRPQGRSCRLGARGQNPAAADRHASTFARGGGHRIDRCRCGRSRRRCRRGPGWRCRPRGRRKRHRPGRRGGAGATPAVSRLGHLGTDAPATHDLAPAFLPATLACVWPALGRLSSGVSRKLKWLGPAPRAGLPQGTTPHCSAATLRHRVKLLKDEARRGEEGRHGLCHLCRGSIG